MSAPSKNITKTSLGYLILVAIAALTNFAFYPVISKIVSQADYANVGIFNAISLQFAALFVALGIIVVNIYQTNEPTAAREKILATQRFVTKTFIIFITIGIVFSPFLKSFFHLPSYGALALLIPYTLISIPLMFLGGFHQNRGSFILMGVFSIVLASAKLLASYVLATASPTLFSIVLALVMSQVAGLLFLMYPLKLRQLVDIFSHKGVSKVAIDLPFITRVLVSIFVLLLLSNIDVLMVKHRFNDVAWEYAGPSLITNGFIFFSTSLAYVMVGHMRGPKKVPENQRALLHIVRLWIPVAVLSIIVFLIFSPTILRILIGESYLTDQTQAYSVLSVIYYCLIGLFYITNTYLLTQKNPKSTHVCIAVLFCALLISAFTGSIIQMLVGLICLALFANLFIAIMIRDNWRRNE
jgi:hypothetical protein